MNLSKLSQVSVLLVHQHLLQDKVGIDKVLTHVEKEFNRIVGKEDLNLRVIGVLNVAGTPTLLVRAAYDGNLVEFGINRVQSWDIKSECVSGDTTEFGVCHQVSRIVTSIFLQYVNDDLFRD